MSEHSPEEISPQLSEQECEQVIRELWELKKNVDRHSTAESKPINFNRLLREQPYRDLMLRALVNFKRQVIAKSARSLLKRQLQGSVHIDDLRQQQNAGSNSPQQVQATQQYQQQLSGSLKSIQSQLRRWRAASATLLALLLMSSAWHAYPLLVDVGSKRVVVNQSIIEDTTWSADKEYILSAPIFVDGAARLTIEPGTRIQGEPGSALIVTQDAQIMAKGRASAPIIFTSSQAPGERERGDWGGVVLLGKAPINQGSALIEGLDSSDTRGRFGGSDPSHNCGVLEYVRVEFAGFEAFVDNELNGLTLGGCGSDTIVRHVQVHKALDDGIEVFGGTVNLSNIVISGPGDDAFDWDMGWQGKLQFMVAQMHGDDGDNALEGDNSSSDDNATPRSEPTFYNLTLIGGNTQQTAHRGMTIRRGSGGQFGNILLMGFSQEAIDLRGSNIRNLVSQNRLNFSGLLLDNINGGRYFSDEAGESDDDGGFDEARYFSNPSANARFSLDLRMPAEVFNAYAPNFTPMSHSPARDKSVPIPQGEFWDESANFIGAIRPGAPSNWLAQWTAFPSS